MTIPKLTVCEPHEWDELALASFQSFKKTGNDKWICPGCFGDMKVNAQGVSCSTCKRELRPVQS